MRRANVTTAMAAPSASESRKRQSKDRTMAHPPEISVRRKRVIARDPALIVATNRG